MQSQIFKYFRKGLSAYQCAIVQLGWTRLLDQAVGPEVYSTWRKSQTTLGRKVMSKGGLAQGQSLCTNKKSKVVSKGGRSEMGCNTSRLAEQCAVEEAPQKSPKAPANGGTVHVPMQHDPETLIMMTAKKHLIDVMRVHVSKERHLTFYAPNAEIVFGGVRMLIEHFVEEHDNLLRSFPDFDVALNDSDVSEDAESGIVTFHNIVASGTHTGAAYGFGPYPSVATTGIRCVNDPETVALHYDQNCKVKKLVVTPLGPSTGPPGFYQNIGGILM